MAGWFLWNIRRILATRKKEEEMVEIWRVSAELADGVTTKPEQAATLSRMAIRVGKKKVSKVNEEDEVMQGFFVKQKWKMILYNGTVARGFITADEGATLLCHFHMNPLVDWLAQYRDFFSIPPRGDSEISEAATAVETDEVIDLIEDEDEGLSERVVGTLSEGLKQRA